MQDWLAARRSASPEQTAIIFNDGAVTYAELDELVSRAQTRLREVGVREGMAVGVLMHNSIDYAVLVHALARLGAVLVPLNTRLTPNELNWQLERAQVKLLLYDGNTAEKAAQLEPNRMQFTIDTLPQYQPMRPEHELDLDTAQAIVFTSGTTGHPKGAVMTFGNHFYSAMGSAYRLGHQPGDRWLSVLPLYHVGGLALLFRSTLYGITTVLHGQFDVDAVQHSFDTHQVTMISLVPTMLYRMLEAGTRWPDSLRLILLGGAAASPELLRRAFDANLPVAPTYGLTEAASQVATMRPAGAKEKPGSVGKPLLMTSVRVVNEQGDTLPPGEVGEIVVKGPTVMKGYHRSNEATAKTLRSGELYTGDMGYLDAGGDLWLVTRRSDLIVSGGENVYPAEVEQVLRAHPAVADACVVGVDHMEWGQQVAAAVVLQNRADITEENLINYAREHLAGYKQPRRVRFINSLPLTASGKVSRAAVRALFQS